MADAQRLTRSMLGRMFDGADGQDARPELVGVEVEHGLVQLTTGRSVDYAGAQAFLDRMIRGHDGSPILDGAYIVGVGLPGGASLTLETGGALEYASAPAARIADVVRTTRTDLLRTAAAAAELGMGLLSGAILPFTERRRIPWIPKPRVQVMRDYFAGLGDAGRYGDEVMGVTLSTQTSLDYRSSADLLAKARLHVLAAPVIAALFVNSPLADGRDSGVLSRRMQYWQHFDPRRCGVLGFLLRPDATVEDLIDWATELPMIYRSAGGTHVAAPDVPFGRLLRDGFGDGTWPTAEDWELHLSQQWPHLRIRRTLELRACDGLPWPHFSAAPALWAGLTYDPDVRQEATALLADLTPAQLDLAVNDIAVKGLAASVGPHHVQELARELLRLARKGLTSRVQAGTEPPEVLTYLEPVEQVCESSQTFADRCLVSWDGPLGHSPAAYVDEYRVPVA